jgi:acetolactate synthase I/II/III large subunit
MRPTEPKSIISGGSVSTSTSLSFPPSDIAAVARGLGARAATVRGDVDLAALKRWVAEGSPGVFVLDAKICPMVEADWHSDAYAA